MERALWDLFFHLLLLFLFPVDFFPSERCSGCLFNLKKKKKKRHTCSWRKKERSKYEEKKSSVEVVGDTILGILLFLRGTNSVGRTKVKRCDEK